MSLHPKQWKNLRYNIDLSEIENALVYGIGISYSLVVSILNVQVCEMFPIFP